MILNTFRKIKIDVAENDRVDIKCGGPHLLGFDFVVEAKTKKHWKDFLEKIKKSRPDFPFFRYTIGKPYSTKKIWTEKEIGSEILNYEI